MSFYARLFNIYFMSFMTLTLATSGCASWHHKPKEPVGAVRIHVESPATIASQTHTVSVLRADPVVVRIGNDPILTETDLLRAQILHNPGGFYVELVFDEIGKLTLEQFTGAEEGRHLAIFAQWGDHLKDGRWVAAPVIDGRNASGRLSFTPDMSREEAEAWVTGLNATAKKLQTGK